MKVFDVHDWTTAFYRLSVFALLLGLTACAPPAERAAQDACDCLTPLHNAQIKAEKAGEKVDPDKLMQLSLEMSTCFVKLEKEFPEMGSEPDEAFKKAMDKHMQEICPEMVK